jgi:hypothetical protein
VHGFEPGCPRCPTSRCATPRASRWRRSSRRSASLSARPRTARALLGRLDALVATSGGTAEAAAGALPGHYDVIGGGCRPGPVPAGSQAQPDRARVASERAAARARRAAELAELPTGSSSCCGRSR